MDKAFLIDVASKIYVATDASHVEMQALELCSDMIDVVIDVSCIYGFVFVLNSKVGFSFYHLSCSADVCKYAV
jgi:hypothetical protein